MTDRETLRHALAELLEADTGETYPDLKEDVQLRDGLGLDSVDVVSLVAQIERRFRVRLTHEELESLTAVGDVLDLIQAKTAAAPGRAAA